MQFGLQEQAVEDVYVDLLFLINAGMDWLCFRLAARLLKRRVPPGRLVLGSLLGGVYAVCALFLTVGRGTALLIDAAVCVLLCLVVFARRGDGIRRLSAAAGVYLLVSLLMGGVMTGLYNALNRAGCAEAVSGGEDGPDAWLFLLLALAGGLVSLCGGRLLRRTGSRRPCVVTVTLNGRTAVFSGMVDTGNLLRDPIGGRPVVPVDAERAAGLVSPALLSCIGSPEPEKLAGVPEAARLRLIPASTATGQTLLVGIRPDRMTIETDAGNASEPVEVSALFAPVTMPAGDPDDAPQALVPASLL